MRLNLEEMLLDENLFRPGQLQAARSYQHQNRVSLGKAVVSLGFLADDVICGLLYAAPRPLVGHPRSRHRRSRHARDDPGGDGQVLPGAALFRSGGALTVAMADPTNELALEHVRLVAGCDVKPVVAIGVGARAGDRPLLRKGAHL